jgi:hypothetical protein
VILVQQTKIRRHLQLGKNLPFGFLILIFSLKLRYGSRWEYSKGIVRKMSFPRSLCALKRLRKLITKLIKKIS